MPRLVELQNADASPLLAFDFGTVLPGTSSAQKALQLANTGDVAVSIRAWVENNSGADGLLTVTFGGVAVTAATPATAADLGTLAPGATLSGLASYAVPGMSVGLAQVQSRFRFQYV